MAETKKRDYGKISILKLKSYAEKHTALIDFLLFLASKIRRTGKFKFLEKKLTACEDNDQK